MNTLKVSKYMSFLLRHKPEDGNLKIDEHGYCDTEDLIRAVSKRYPEEGFDMEELQEVVKTDDKKRYSFKDGFKMIRADQGHSFPVDLELEPKRPPAFLYHGTSTNHIEKIIENGITPQTRNYVHLSPDFDTAMEVGKRHGDPVVLMIEASDMYRDGYPFYQSENGVWLSDFIPFDYVKEVRSKEV